MQPHEAYTIRRIFKIHVKLEHNMKQKFYRGNLVQVAVDLGVGRGHFPSDCRAIVLGSYADQDGGNDTSSYTLHVERIGVVSWYNEEDLTLLCEDASDLLEKWVAEDDAAEKRWADLDWIFDNGVAVLNEAHGATIHALALNLGISDVYCGTGEHNVYVENAMITLRHAAPYLKVGDKDGWLAHCAEVRTQFKEFEEKNGELK
jgi:hypothetical protein